MKKTTVVLDETLLQEAKEATGAKTKKETIETALSEVVKRHQRKLLIEEMGTYNLDLEQDDIEKMRGHD
ncbi:type II toxin-antitoxin system VapB family antitoxin [Candidatus Marinimicrobia bacterium MT.SAG.4]|nr:type II toxin-antitoxin system VapB family antitoxin [Candidatus Marinimicrobia bacterium MT.SAG.4]